MTCQSLISDLSGVESPSAATARMHLLRRFSRYGPEKLAPHAGGPCVCGERLKHGPAPSLVLSRSCRAGRDSIFRSFWRVLHHRLFATSHYVSHTEHTLTSHVPQYVSHTAASATSRSLHSAGESRRGMRPPLPASRRPAFALALQTPHPGEAGQQPSST